MAMCIMADVGVAPCQCFSPGGNHTTSPAYLLDWPALTLDEAAAERNDQGLTEWVSMPRGPGTWLECDACAGHARWFGCLEQRVDSDRAGEILRRPFAGRF